MLRALTPGRSGQMTMAEFAASWRNFGSEYPEAVGTEYMREIVKVMLGEAHRRHAVFQVSGRLLRSTRPYSGNPRRGAGFGARMPTMVQPSAVDAMKFDLRRPAGITNSASSRGYAYSWQIWRGRGFRSGQMRGSKSMPRGISEVVDYARSQERRALKRAVETVERQG